MSASSNRGPQRVAVVGAGMVGLCTAWYLQQRDVEVTVFESTDVAAGSSWGNAGWLTPSIATPLPEPAVLRYGIRAVLSHESPVYVPPALDPNLIRFLLQFVRNCTASRWHRAMQALIPLNRDALAAFDEMEVELPEKSAPAQPFIAAYRSEADRRTLLEEFDQIKAAGQRVNFEILDGATARAEEPALSAEVKAAIRILDERFLNPAAYVRALAEQVRARGGKLVIGTAVDAVRDIGTGVVVGGERFDAVVVATGARLNRLLKPFGVRRLVQAGRGYSFTVKVDHLPRGPVYFPTQRVACTPVGDRLRIAGMMEFRSVDAPMDPRRIQVLRNAASELLNGAHLDDRQDEWVGARPCTADGLPLIGATTSPRVFAAGGHGMWGITLGPVTGRLLAEQITTGRTPDALRAVNPLR
ncbi:FAD-binding oxidoreductase [uncultured Mycolicibacterium sp.]|uniref:NAD(P)/FAD-dependent oxidoreductase n=1 Tax=uncultured Mycolicibacterium sp. TaxID=2320817 RepID=UPI002621CC5D|nr:FAD-dependent oxidoreductase [uncultured Mycolicibacterium sp.]